MRLNHRRGSLVSSLLLIAALLLYPAGAVLDPFVHLALDGGAASTQLAEHCTTDFEAPAPAEFEHDCVACKLARSLHLAPAAGVKVGGVTVAAAPLVDGASGSRAPPARASLQPRAPPHA